MAPDSSLLRQVVEERYDAYVAECVLRAKVEVAQDVYERTVVE